MTANRQSSDPFKQVWHFFASVKLTVVLLLTLAITSILGTLIPQNETPAEYVRAFGEVLYRIFYILDIFDMYRSWWFQFLLLMLASNVVVCSLERLSSTWKIVFTKNPTFNPAQVQRLTDKVQFATGLLPDQVEKKYMPFLTKKFGYTRIEDTENGYCIYSEKGRWTRLGVYAVHLSVLILLVGGLVGSIFGFEGFVNIPEGETVVAVLCRRPHASINSGASAARSSACRFVLLVAFGKSGLMSRNSGGIRGFPIHLLVIEDQSISRTATSQSRRP